MAEHERHIRLLAQYAGERIDDLLSHQNPPRDLYDMTTWRLDRPEYLLEVVGGVLADPGFREKWTEWLAFKRELLGVAQPAWTRGFEAYGRATTGSGDDLTSLGINAALEYEENQSKQMWFLEGWLAAQDEEK